MSFKLPGLSYIWSVRISGILLAYVSVLQILLLAYYANFELFPLAILFLFALSLTTVCTFLSVINSWSFKKPDLFVVAPGKEPQVAVLIPTYGEPIKMVLNTVYSVLSQNYPLNKLVIVVSDDSHNPKLEQKIKNLAFSTKAKVIYNHPPQKGEINRLGDSKAGNLNSALHLILQKYPSVEYIETRDADDLVGNRNFLRLGLGSLLSNKNAAFVQTIKRSLVSPNDPFFNQEEFFYERTMFFRAADNSVFPCGSGLIWRKKDLLKINGFPVWNLVEDLQSGYEILKHKKTGLYLPIVGAVGQIAPEDIPNFYKQRGTWAIDSLRLLFWDNPFFNRRLTFKQKTQFFDLFFSYVLAIPMLLFPLFITSCLAKNVCAVQDLSPIFILINVLFIILLELNSIIKARGLSYKVIWNGRQNWIGLSPVFLVATIKALFYGPNKKPSYKVTRKKHQFSFYWQETLPQQLITLFLIAGIFIKLNDSADLKTTDIVLLYWAAFLVAAHYKVLKNSFFGIDIKQQLSSFGKNLIPNIQPAFRFKSAPNL